MAEFDIVIHGGRVIDGTGNPWFYGDVAIRNGKIAEIGKIKSEAGARAISAKGYVVTPGFIDMHTHSDQPIIADGNAESKVRQGVTPAVNAVAVILVVATVAVAIAAEIRRRNAAGRAMEAARVAQQADVEMAAGLQPQEAPAR